MAGGYVICEYETVRQGFPAFRRVETEAKSALLTKAFEDWKPKQFGGMKPTGGQFGMSSIIPALFKGVATTVLPTWRQTFTTTGHQTILYGANTGNTIYEDYKIGLVGLAFLDKAVKVAEIKMQISDRKLPRVNLNEALAYNKPAIVFEDYFLLDEETGFDLYGYVTVPGQQRIKLLGVELNRIPNKLQVTNTGAALT